MSRAVVAFAALAMLAGCTVAHHRAIHGPDGQPGWFTISCRRSAGACYEEAGDTCPGGYDVADRNGQTGAVVAPIGDRASVVAPTFQGDMLIKCHGRPAVADDDDYPPPSSAPPPAPPPAPDVWIAFKGARWTFTGPSSWTTENNGTYHAPYDEQIAKLRIVADVDNGHAHVLSLYREGADNWTTALGGREANFASETRDGDRFTTATIVGGGKAYDLTCIDADHEATSKTCMRVLDSFRVMGED